MHHDLTDPARRDWLIRLALAGGAVSLGLPMFAGAAGGKDPRHDWDWLIGDFDVWHKRLKHRLAGSNEWVKSTAGEKFSVPGNSSFQIKVTEAYHYICHFG